MSFFVFLIGSMIGSFLNVVIHRLPLKEDLVFKPSHCPKCMSSIPWYSNIPLLGYISLLGRCRNCKEVISFRYPFVELICGLAALFLFPAELNLESIYQFLVFYVSFCIFIAHIFIDLKHYILPDSLNFILLLLLGSFAFRFFPWQRNLLGFLIGFGGTYSVAWVFYKLKGKMGLGGGDIKLFGILGIFLGPMGILYNLFLSCFLGAIIGFIQIGLGRMNKEEPLPFGPFIIFVAIIQIYFPNLFDIFRQLVL